MAVSKALFNNKSLAILNMLEAGETLEYDWSVNEDYSIVLFQGDIDVNGTLVSGVAEHRVQPNENLQVRCLSEGRAYFISLFKVEREELADQILNQDSKNRIYTFVPDWYDTTGYPASAKQTWEDDFISGDYIYTKTILNEQIQTSDRN